MRPGWWLAFDFKVPTLVPSRYQPRYQPRGTLPFVFYAGWWVGTLKTGEHGRTIGSIDVLLFLKGYGGKLAYRGATCST